MVGSSGETVSKQECYYDAVAVAVAAADVVVVGNNSENLQSLLEQPCWSYGSAVADNGIAAAVAVDDDLNIAADYEGCS